MVRLLDIKRTYSDGGMRLLLLADSRVLRRSIRRIL